MHRKYFVVIVFIAVASALLAAIYIWKEAHAPPPIAKMLISQPISPFKSYISGVGIVEASSKNIFIGTPVNRVVDKVKVVVGEKVKKNQVLFCLESRDLEADLHTRSIAYENSIAKLQKLKALPRTEDVAASEAVLKGSEIELAQAKSLYEAVQGLKNNGALSKEEINRRRFNFELAEAKFQQSQADFNKTKAGAWLPDLEIARLEVLQAKAYVQRVETDIQRTIIRAPIAGTVLQVKISEGEFPPSAGPPMILGNIDALHLRVSINQFDASYFHPEAPAVAFLQGNSKQEFPLKFVNIEPYFVTKQNLTNDITEKVDTRVLQVIYCFTENDQRIFVGQQMDVFIETEY
jgi:HlyD family secretion protein